MEESITNHVSDNGVGIQNMLFLKYNSTIKNSKWLDFKMGKEFE